MDEHLSMIVSGPSGCGKTRYVTNLLRGELRYHFNDIAVVCPTLKYNQEWRGFGEGDPRVNLYSPPIDDVGELTWLVDTLCEYHSGPSKTLIIFDDLASGKFSKDRSSPLTWLAFSGRHAGLSNIHLVQQLTSLTKPVRDNANEVVAFYSSSRQSNQTLFDEFAGHVTGEQRKRILDELASRPYAHLRIRNRYPRSITLSKGVGSDG